MDEGEKLRANAMPANVIRDGDGSFRVILSEPTGCTAEIFSWKNERREEMLFMTNKFLDGCIGLFLSKLLVKQGHQVTLFTRGKAPIAQQLPGESDADFSGFSSKILHLKGDRKDFDFVKTSLSAQGLDVVYDINVSCQDVKQLKSNPFLMLFQIFNSTFAALQMEFT